MYFLYRLFICIILVVSLSSCSSRIIIVNEISNISEIGAVVFEQDDDLEMVEKGIPGNIKFLEVILENNPDNYKILVLLSRLYAAYSFGFYEGRLEYSLIAKSHSVLSGHNFLKESVNRYYFKGADYALRAIESRHTGADEKLKVPESADYLLKTMRKEDVPALFWYGFNLSSLINNNRDSVLLLSKAYLIEKIMKRIIELDPEYFFGGPHLILLSYYSSLPPYSNEKLDLSLFHYRKLKERKDGPFLLADLYFARYYLTRKQEKEKFENIMNGILKHSGKEKEYIFYNKIAAQRAKIYLEGIDHFFQ
ncbi:MAG: TRAP transporter TatT component family protein [Proteobacteria bacterium]|nr:TRAP transporter TatT component family protein [Pseudomonadota bacterium]MBU1712326.1 TRAP transporter TatT component family protein [Pseudomonadota bacterium]